MNDNRGLSSGPEGLSPERHAKLRRLRSIRNAKDGYLFLLPWIVGFALFVAFPFVYSIVISFHKVGINAEGTRFAYRFVGWANYKYAFFTDNEFPIEMINFTLDALMIIPVTVIFAFCISILLSQRFPGRFLFRTIFFLPVIFASGQVIDELFQQNQGSVPLLEQYNLSAALFEILPYSLAETLLTLLGKVVLILWFSGVQTVLFIAAFQTVPVSTYEAAKIDGATAWSSFWKITFPAIVPFITLNIVYTAIEMSSSPFNPILRLLKENLADTKTGYGYVSAIGWLYALILIVIILLFTVVIQFYDRKRE